jgi:hypothetical protein
LANFAPEIVLSGFLAGSSIACLRRGRELRLVDAEGLDLNSAHKIRRAWHRAEVEAEQRERVREVRA